VPALEAEVACLLLSSEFASRGESFLVISAARVMFVESCEAVGKKKMKCMR
jgi:hypothetical protein